MHYGGSGGLSDLEGLLPEVSAERIALYYYPPNRLCSSPVFRPLPASRRCRSIRVFFSQSCNATAVISFIRWSTNLIYCKDPPRDYHATFFAVSSAVSEADLREPHTILPQEDIMPRSLLFHQLYRKQIFESLTRDEQVRLQCFQNLMHLR